MTKNGEEVSTLEDLINVGPDTYTVVVTSNGSSVTDNITVVGPTAPITVVSTITPATGTNSNGAIGLSAGISHFRLRAQYIYGFTNMLGKLNKNNLETLGNSESKFKGNQSMLAFTAMITF